MRLMRRGCLVVGLLALALVWSPSVQAVTAYSFAAHMTVHMMVVAVAAPLLAVASVATRFDPVRLAPRLFAPIAASLVELVVVWAWHAPVLHHAARAHGAVLLLEQASFLAAGLYLWLAIVGGTDPWQSTRTGSGIVALALTFAHMTLLGALLALAPRPLYHYSLPSSAAGLLADQQLGGIIMLMVGAVVYIGGGLWLSRDLLQPRMTPVGRR